MEDIIKLETFSIEKIDTSNYYHKCLIINLTNDSVSYEYLGDMEHLIQDMEVSQSRGKKDQLYAVINNQEYIGIIGYFELLNSLYLYISLLPEMRNKGFGSTLIKEFSEYVFSAYPDEDKLCATINSSNLYSIKSHRKAGFIKETQNRYTLSRTSTLHKN